MPVAGFSEGLQLLSFAPLYRAQAGSEGKSILSQGLETRRYEKVVSMYKGDREGTLRDEKVVLLKAMFQIVQLVFETTSGKI